MEFVKDSHMSRLKKGKFKDGEQFVFCRLRAPELQNCPEIHIFTDGSSSNPEQVLKVKSFAAVRESDQVCKVVKARYDNYIYIRSEKGMETYLRTDTRQQRDEWCATLQELMNIGAARQDVVVRERAETDVTSNKPPPMRNLRDRKTVTAPGTALDVLHKEMSMKLEKRNLGTQKTDDDDTSCEHMCCAKHHIEGDSDINPIYENVHYILNEDQWKEDSKTSKTVLQRNARLYSDFHNLHDLQVQQEDEDIYEVTLVDQRKHDRMAEENRLSGYSTSPVDSTGSVPNILSATDGKRPPCESAYWRPSPEPVKSKWSPGDTPVTLCSRTTLDPEAEVEFTTPTEPIYKNSVITRPKPPRKPMKNPSRQRGNSSIVQPCQPTVPRRTSSVAGHKIRALTEEKKLPFIEIAIDRQILTRQLPTLAQVHDGILITHVPDGLKNYFRVGDQWLKINDQLFNSVDLAKSCIEMSDKNERVVNFIVKRLPYGTICNFRWTSNNRDDVGLELNGPEISEWKARGIAMTHSNLRASDTTSLTTAGVRCNYAITEVNFEPIHPHSTTETVWREIESAKPDILLILHPQDFFSFARPFSHKLR